MTIAAQFSLPGYLEIPPHKTQRCRVKAADLKIDPDVQREFRQPYAEKIAANWSPELANPLHLSRRSDEADYVIDGQHTLWAGEHNGQRSFDAIRHYDLTPTQEAALHLRLQSERRADNAYDIWRLKLAAGSPEHLAAQRILASRGLTIGGHIRAAGAVDWVVSTYGAETLLGVISAIEAAWPSPKREDWDNSIIRALGYLFGGYPGVAQPLNLGKKLGKEFTSAGLVAAIKARAKGTGGTHSRKTIGAALIAEVWNRRRSRNLYPLGVPGLVPADEEDEEDDELA